MLNGSSGILVHLRGVDSLKNDDSVEVGIHANADPIQLSGKRKAISFASYAIDPDRRFQARTRGRIVNGVLTTEPVNLRFHHTVNNIWLERPIDAARLRLTFTKEGGIEGIMAGYSQIEELFDYVVGMRSGKNADGTPKDPRTLAGSSGGSSGSAGMTCNGFYHSLKQLADRRVQRRLDPVPDQGDPGVRRRPGAHQHRRQNQLMRIARQFLRTRTLVDAGAGLALAAAAYTGPGVAQPSATSPQASAQALEPETTSGAPMVRHLTGAQYRASIAQVFGPDVPIVGRFERGLREHGLLAIGTSEAGISRCLPALPWCVPKAAARTSPSPRTRVRSSSRRAAAARHQPTGRR